MIVKLAVVEPASTVTDGGTGADTGSELVRVTTASESGETPSVTVPVLVPPPVTELGVSVNAVST
ncbi:MAG: hypothetical protein K2X12_01940, partial [Burkholderiaceae bacterium]|nr:hypothetical protein [Burkholderiaceae bacterium]